MSQFDVLRIALDMMTEEEVSCKRQDRGNVVPTLCCRRAHPPISHVLILGVTDLFVPYTKRTTHAAD
jgi:hypothetical protein